MDHAIVYPGSHCTAVPFALPLNGRYHTHAGSCFIIPTVALRWNAFSPHDVVRFSERCSLRSAVPHLCCCLAAWPHLPTDCYRFPALTLPGQFVPTFSHCAIGVPTLRTGSHTPEPAFTHAVGETCCAILAHLPPLHHTGSPVLLPDGRQWTFRIPAPATGRYRQAVAVTYTTQAAPPRASLPLPSRFSHLG